MTVNIHPGKAHGRIAAPPSKSMAHRLLICAGLSQGVSTIRGIDLSQDVLATMDCLEAMGAKYHLSNGCVQVEGIDPRKIEEAKTLPCRESGSTLRFFLPLCLLCGKQMTLRGSQSLFARPLSVYQSICKSQGLQYAKSEDHVTVQGVLQAGEFKIPGNISSQFISGLLFALPLLEQDSVITISVPIESRSYIELTLEALQEFGVSVIWQTDRSLLIKGNQRYCTANAVVEGDYSNAAFFGALNALGGAIKIDGLREDSRQGDRIYQRFFELLCKGMPSVNISDCPDLGPVLFALASAKNGGVFTGTGRLRMKESDRCAVMAEELRKFGVSITVGEDSVVIYPGQFHKPQEVLQGHNDHRVVMALASILTTCGGTIAGAEAVNKSFPDFFDKLKQVGIQVETLEP